jgi:uncharacterized protein (DUF1684 family)
MGSNEYESQILLWQARKYDERVGENGWMSLAGLFWLNQGRNLVGSNPMCEVTLPEHAPTFLGIIEWKGKTIRLQVAEGVQVQVNGRLVQSAVIRSDRAATPSFITWNQIRLVLHEYAGKYGVRIWDNQKRNRFTLPLLKWFPINKQFRFSARYTRYPEPKVSSQLDAFGEKVEDRLDGYVTFKFDGKTYKLDVTEEKDHRLFKNLETSRTARRLIHQAASTWSVNGGKVTLDFNYAYSPPCAFTEYATCIFAPQQNYLPFRVEAGEIYRG